MSSDKRGFRLTASASAARASPLRTVRVLGRPQTERAASQGSEIEASASFTMVEYRAGRQTLYAGRVRYGVREVDGKLKLARKRVYLIDADAVHDAISIPF